VNSRLFIIAGYGAWYLTFVLGFFILAPSTDDGYYVIAAMGTVLEGSPGFWIGDEFSPVFFLPTAFTYVYGLLLKLTMSLGMDFGAFGFRFYQFVFVLLLPVISTWMLRRLFPSEYAFRLLLLLVGLSITHFVQSAATVRPEVLGAVLFTVFLALRGSNGLRGSARLFVPVFVLALGGVLHPIFTLLAVVVFGVGLVRKYRRIGLTGLNEWVVSFVAFGLPFGALGIYYILNLAEFREQTLGRASFLSTDSLSAPALILENLRFWSNSDGISFGLFSGYPAYGFVIVMAVSTLLVVSRFKYLWGHEVLWVSLPILFVQWMVFLLLPPFLPYLGFSSFLGTLIVVLLWRQPGWLFTGVGGRRVLAVGGFAICLVFIVFQGGKFVLTSEDRLTPAGLHSAMAPVLEGSDAKLYTDSPRLVPPLIDYFSDDGNIRINFTYLNPDCLKGELLERANEHSRAVLASSDLDTTYWALDMGLVGRRSSESADGVITFIGKGAQGVITLEPSGRVYVDNKNAIMRASAVSVEIDEQGACASGLSD